MPNESSSTNPYPRDSTKVAEELGQILDERSILRTLYDYCHAVDYKRADDWVDCFTPDAVFEVVEGGGWGGSVRRGSEELRRSTRTHWRQQGMSKHLVALPVIRVDGDSAEVTSYYFGFNDAAGGAQFGGFGRYDDRMERCADGRWRIAHRRFVGERKAGDTSPDQVAAPSIPQPKGDG